MPEIIERKVSLFDDIDRFTTFVDEFFEGYLPGFFDRDKGKISAKELYYEVILSPSEASDGGLFPITVPIFEPYPRCRKTGWWGGFFVRYAMVTVESKPKENFP